MVRVVCRVSRLQVGVRTYIALVSVYPTKSLPLPARPQRGATAEWSSGSGAEMQLGASSAGRGRSGAQRERGAAAAGRRCTCARLKRGAAAAGRRCSGVGMRWGGNAARHGCGWLLLQRGGPSDPHSSVPLSAALRRERGRENEVSLPNPPGRPLSLSLSHLLVLPN
jgi:hypothetical protein